MRVSKADGKQVLDLQWDALIGMGVDSDRYVFERIPLMKAEDYHQLLPWKVILPEWYVEKTP